MTYVWTVRRLDAATGEYRDDASVPFSQWNVLIKVPAYSLVAGETYRFDVEAIIPADPEGGVWWFHQELRAVDAEEAQAAIDAMAEE